MDNSFPRTNSMKRLHKKNINSLKYWDSHIADPGFGLRQQKYIELAGKGNKIIELGCGLSPFAEKARKNFKESYALDFSYDTIKEFKNKYPKVNCYISDAKKTPFPDKFFDVSVAGEMIEHLEKPMELLEEMKRITKRKIILSTAHMEYDEPEHLWLFDKEDFPGAETEEIKSDWFPGRSYLFVTIDL